MRKSLQRFTPDCEKIRNFTEQTPIICYNDLQVEMGEADGAASLIPYLLLFLLSMGYRKDRWASVPIRVGVECTLQSWAEDFYTSVAWRKCRKAYMKSAGGLCERCLARGLYVPGVIVHHKTHLTPENITDANISCAFGNLELLCRDCHADEHSRMKKRYSFDADGRCMTAERNV